MTIFKNLRKLPMGVWFFAAALAIRLWGVSHGLPDAPHPDENMVVRRALRFGGGDLNPHFFYYPSFSMYLVFILESVFFIIGRLTGVFQSVGDFAQSFVRDITAVYVIARGLFVVMDALTAALLAGLAKVYFGRRAAIFAGLAWVLFPLAVQYSQIAKPESLMLFLMLLSVWFLRDAKAPKATVKAGLALGLAASSKYTAVLLGPPLALWILTGSAHPTAWKALGVFGATCALGFFIGTPYALLDFSQFLKDFTAQSSVMKIGVTGAEGGVKGWTYYLGLFLNPGDYLLVTLPALMGLFCAGGDRGFKILSAAFLVLVTLMLGNQRIFSSHYFLVGFPFLFLLASAGWSWIWGVFETRRWPAPILTSLLFLIFYAPSLVDLGVHMASVQKKDTRTLAREWIEKNVPPGAKIIMDASGPQLALARPQLEDLLKRAEESGHVKAELFRLQLEADQGGGYNVYLTEQPVMVTPRELLEYSRKVQDLFPLTQGLAGARRHGVSIVVMAGEGEGLLADGPRSRYPDHARFYEELKTKARLEAQFGPTKNSVGPVLWIYRLE